MFSLRDTPIKRKLMLVIMTTTAFALLLMAGTVVTYEVMTYRASVRASTSVLAEVISSMATSSLSFNQADDGQEVLQALAAEPQIRAAALYDMKGALFASFIPGGESELMPPAPGPDGVSFDESSLIIFKPVMEEGNRKGTLYVRSDLGEMYQRLVFYGALVLIAGLGASAVSAVLSSILQRRISGPILDLAAVARVVSERQDYSLRTVPRGKDEIGALTDAFNQMLIRVGENEAALQMAKEMAEAANRAKDEFLAILSHELRTPLTPVLATVNMLREEKDVPAALQPELETIQRNVELEARLIDDLLDLTRISRGKLELHLAVINLRLLLEHAVQSYLSDQAAAKKQTVRVTFAENLAAWVQGDAPRLTQVFWNLMQNAVKFTPEAGCISLRVFNVPAAAETAALPDVVVEITDTGIGIEPENVRRIFNAFEQGERSRTRIFGGLGLGLAISLAIAERHGGTLAAASPGKNQGATFTLRLPSVPAPPAGASSPALPAASSTPGSGTAGHAPALPTPPAHAHARILLVEDHADTVRQLARLLSREGYHVTTAGSVAEATRLGLEQPFDLLVSDLGLPDGSGHQIIRCLAQERQLPGIALSGYGMEEDVKSSLAAGFSLHLTKPIHWPDLKEAVAKLVRERAAL